MKYEDIKRKLVIETSIVVGVVALLSGLAYFLLTWQEDYEQEKNELQTQVASVTNERQTLENKFQKIQQNKELYRELMTKSANDELSVSRNALRNSIELFKKRYFLNDLSINMDAAQELTGPNYRYKSSAMATSELTASFDALTDEDIFSILQSMQKELPGALKITKFTVTRGNKVSDEGLRTIAKNGQYSMVKGDVKLTWFGIKSLEEPAANAQDAPSP